MKLLVPLDGSPLAESVLSAAAMLARKAGGVVTLMHVLEKDPPEKVHGQRHLTDAAQAEEYLSATAASEVFAGVEVLFHVHLVGVRDVSQSISDHTEELKQDMVIMCTHGGSGLHDLLVGSIAQQVVSLSNTPVMLVNPSLDRSKAEPNFDSFLVPLDGNPDHENALEYALRLAELCRAQVQLMIAVPRFANMSGELTVSNRYLPGTTARIMDMAVDDARAYLKKLQSSLESSGLNIKATVSRNNPPRAISKTAKNSHTDLIILATHGKKGAEPFWEGSVTPKVIRSSELPILLVPVRE